MSMIDDKIIYLYDEFTHGSMARREFLGKLAKLAGGAAAATVILPLLEGPSRAASDKAKRKWTHVTQDKVVEEQSEYQGVSGPMKVFTAHVGGETGPAVVVIHQNKGLTGHIREVARRFASEGFFALAPDALSPLGGAPEDPDKGRDMMRTLDRENTTKDFVAAIDWAEGHRYGNGKVGAVGFCWGGSMVGRLAVGSKTLDAGVVYYGSPPPSQEVKNIKARLMLHYAGLDTRIGGLVPAFEAALKAARTDYQLFTYEGAHHAFNDDSREARYDEEAAKLAWRRTVDFFWESLS
jgi:carboxymethylenebutenolidase